MSYYFLFIFICCQLQNYGRSGVSKNLQIFLVFAITFLTILFHPETTIYFIIDMFHNLLMLMFVVLVKWFVLAEVKATMLTIDNRTHTSLIYIFLQIMISSGLVLIRFSLYFHFGDVLLNFFYFAISSFSINSVIAVAFIQVSSLISILCCISWLSFSMYFFSSSVNDFIFIWPSLRSSLGHWHNA